MILARKETKKEISDRIFKLTDQKDYGLCNPPMNAQVALNELARHFLGEDWYSSACGNAEQINTEIVYKIELLHPGKVMRFNKNRKF